MNRITSFLPSTLLVALLSLFLVNASPLLEADQKLPFHGKLVSVDQAAQTITVGKTARVFHLTSTTRITDGSGSPSSLSAAVVGEDVGGSYTKDSAGTLTLYSVRFGAKSAAPATKTASTPVPPPVAPTTPPAPVAAPSATDAPPPIPVATPDTSSAPPASTGAAATDTKVKKQTFSGKVVSVDATANTLVVHGRADQTFTLTSTTKLTGIDGLSSLAAGTKVSGTYSKSPDGTTLTVYTLKAK